MQECLEKVIGMDDYLKENVAEKVKLESMLFAMKGPVFEECEDEASCTETLEKHKAIDFVLPGVWQLNFTAEPF